MDLNQIIADEVRCLRSQSDKKSAYQKLTQALYGTLDDHAACRKVIESLPVVTLETLRNRQLDEIRRWGDLERDLESDKEHPRLIDECRQVKTIVRFLEVVIKRASEPGS